MKTPIFLLAAIILCTASCGDSNNNEPQLLFVQDSGDALLTESYLWLRYVNEQTGWFADRPYRAAGQMPTEEFLTLWDEGSNSFAKDPPNAAFSCVADDEIVNYIVTLSHPNLTRETVAVGDWESTIQYEEVMLGYRLDEVLSASGETITELFLECSGPAHLFIDPLMQQQFFSPEACLGKPSSFQSIACANNSD